MPRTRLALALGVIAGILTIRYPLRLATNSDCLETMLNAPQSEVKQKAPSAAMVRILCYINTYDVNYERKAIHAQNTWARKCDEFWFTSRKPHDKLKVLQLNLTIPETKNHLWVKMRHILRYLYTKKDDFTHFFKADDDTYAFMGNLRFWLGQYSTKEAFVTGYRWNIRVAHGYFSGGAGYVLSQRALELLVDKSIDKHPDCPTADERMEDVKMSICGNAVGVKLYDTLDQQATNVFYPDSIQSGIRQWLTKNHTWTMENELPTEKLYSNQQVSFHYTDAAMMEFLAYYVHPFGQ